eukprot:6209744-Pleurochrysis_carterae.AAC.1
MDLRLILGGYWAGKTLDHSCCLLLSAVVSRFMQESTPIWERHRQIKAWPLSRAIEVSLQVKLRTNAHSTLHVRLQRAGAHTLARERYILRVSPCARAFPRARRACRRSSPRRCITATTRRLQ